MCRFYSGRENRGAGTPPQQESLQMESRKLHSTAGSPGETQEKEDVTSKRSRTTEQVEKFFQVWDKNLFDL